MDGDGALVHLVLLDRDGEHILVLEGDISDCAVHDALNIDREDTPCAVGLHAMEHSTRREGFFGETAGILDKRTDGGGAATKVVLTRMINGTSYLNSVLVATEDGVDCH